MNVLIVFDSLFGNTERIARAIEEGIAADHVVRCLAAPEVDLSRERPDLLVVGGPTERHGMSPGLHAALGVLRRGQLRGTRVAAFDTRYRMAALLSGSAADAACRQLRRAGGEVVAHPESFFMARDRPATGEKRRHELEQLEPGEVERARAWGRGLATTV